MNLKELATVVRTDMAPTVRVSQDDAELIIEMALSRIAQVVASGESVKLRKFGTFERRAYPARSIMNMNSRKLTTIAERFGIKFIPGNGVKETVKGEIL